MRTFENISKRPFDEDGPLLYKKRKISINPGVTCIVGCNGSGKTTLLEIIKYRLKSEKIPYIYFGDASRRKNDVRSRAFAAQDYGLFSNLFIASEGEGSVLSISQNAREIGSFVRKHQDDNELWIIIDSLDAGLSIDNILNIQENLFKTIIDSNQGKDIYILESTNSYELAHHNDCINVQTFEHVKFKTYEGYKKFVLKTLENRNNMNPDGK